MVRMRTGRRSADRKGLLQNSFLKKSCTKPGTFSRPKWLKKGSGFLIFRYFFVEIAIVLLFCNSPLQFKFLIQEKLDGYKNICQRGNKCFILLLRPLWAPLGVLSGTEELFVFIPPQHKSVYVAGGVFQTVLVQHPGALGKAHTRQPVVLCHDHIPRFYPVHQRKVYAVSPFIEHQCLSTFPLDLVRGVAQDDDRNIKLSCNLQCQVDHRTAVCINQNLSGQDPSICFANRSVA